jgi:hypothetical protein
VNGIGQQAKVYLSPLPTTRPCTKVMKSYTRSYLKNEERKKGKTHTQRILTYIHMNIHTTYINIHIHIIISTCTQLHVYIESVI